MLFYVIQIVLIAKLFNDSSFYVCFCIKDYIIWHFYKEYLFLDFLKYRLKKHDILITSYNA